MVRYILSSLLILVTLKCGAQNIGTECWLHQKWFYAHDSISIFQKPASVIAFSFDGVSGNDTYVLKRFFAEIHRFINLEAIEIKGCSLDSLPEDITRLKKLSTILLYNVKFKNEPTVLSKLRNIECFAACNSINFEKVDLRLVGIKHLYLDNCFLHSFPESLVNISTLESLSMRSNKIETLPPTINKLRKLRTLRIDDNPLEKLPDELGQLRGLQMLSITRTKVSKIPISLFSIKKLRVVISSVCSPIYGFISLDELLKVIDNMPKNWKVIVADKDW